MRGWCIAVLSFWSQEVFMPSLCFCDKLGRQLCSPLYDQRSVTGLELKQPRALLAAGSFWLVPPRTHMLRPRSSFSKTLKVFIFSPQNFLSCGLVVLTLTKKFDLNAHIASVQNGNSGKGPGF